ncbi:ceramide kinase-like [Mizuhopecten yessoensis]|uniref:Ceramide kinase n=1 Tax=Mizuhopecten yessoensis TaxID=6573 RepID=A0A210QJ98_MIZYE|nr:ceramide kinase-like [Mizuhopecten yessoensis]OWF48848.1 Ceramide kinase [Mizuhopecten yessoensis]
MEGSGQFIVDGQHVAAEFTSDHLIWTDTSSKKEVWVETDNIICCTTTTEETGFEVVYAAKSKKNDSKLREGRIVFSGPADKVRIFSRIIQGYLAENKRPRRLLILINPESGKKRGYKDYVNKVQPILERCGIQAEAVVTTGKGQPTEILGDYDLDSIDGLVAMGGDGFYCECLNGLIVRRQTDAGVDFNDSTAELSAPTIPIGILPAGTGDYVVQYLHGTRCLVTAVLRILMGKSVNTNSASIHEDNRCLAHSGLVLGFGLFGDMMHNCEKYRWMGSNRYNIVPIASLLRRRTVDVEIEYLPAKSSASTSSPSSRDFKRQISLPVGNYKVSMAPRLRRQSSVPDILINITNGWQKTTGRVYAVDTHPIVMAAKDGRMRPCFGAENLTMTVTDKCSLSKHVQQLSLVNDEKPDCYNFDFVRQMNVDAFKVRLSSSTPLRITKTGRKELDKNFFINCDGEAIRLTTPQFEVRFHRNIVSLFGTPST